MSELERLLRSACRRDRAATLLHAGGRGLVLGLGASVGLLGVDRLVGLGVPAGLPLLPPLLGLGGAVVVAARRRPDVVRLAAQLDAALGLADRIGSAAALGGTRATGSGDQGTPGQRASGADPAHVARADAGRVAAEGSAVERASADLADVERADEGRAAAEGSAVERASADLARVAPTDAGRATAGERVVVRASADLADVAPTDEGRAAAGGRAVVRANADHADGAAPTDAAKPGRIVDPGFAAFVIRDAERVARGLAPAAAIPLRLDRSWLIAAALALAVIVLAFLPARSADRTMASATTADAAAATAATELRQAAALARGPRQPDDADTGPRDDAARALDELAQRLADGTLDADAARTRAAARLGEEADALERRAAAERKAAEDLARRFRGATPPDRAVDDPARSVARALESGDLDRAAEALDRIERARETLDESARRDLAQELRRLADLGRTPLPSDEGVRRDDPAIPGAETTGRGGDDAARGRDDLDTRRGDRTEEQRDDPAAASEDPAATGEDPAAMGEDPAATGEDPSARSAGGAREDESEARREDPAGREDDPATRRRDVAAEDEDPVGPRGDQPTSADERTGTAAKPADAPDPAVPTEPAGPPAPADSNRAPDPDFSEDSATSSDPGRPDRSFDATSPPDAPPGDVTEPTSGAADRQDRGTPRRNASDAGSGRTDSPRDDAARVADALDRAADRLDGPRSTPPAERDDPRGDRSTDTVEREVPRAERSANTGEPGVSPEQRSTNIAEREVPRAERPADTVEPGAAREERSTNTAEREVPRAERSADTVEPGAAREERSTNTADPARPRDEHSTGSGEPGAPPVTSREGGAAPPTSPEAPRNADAPGDDRAAGPPYDEGAGTPVAADPQREPGMPESATDDSAGTQREGDSIDPDATPSEMLRRIAERRGDGARAEEEAARWRDLARRVARGDSPPRDPGSATPGAGDLDRPALDDAARRRPARGADAGRGADPAGADPGADPGGDGRGAESPSPLEPRRRNAVQGERGADAPGQAPEPGSGAGDTPGWDPESFDTLDLDDGSLEGPVARWLDRPGTPGSESGTGPAVAPEPATGDTPPARRVPTAQERAERLRRNAERMIEESDLPPRYHDVVRRWFRQLATEASRRDARDSGRLPARDGRPAPSPGTAEAERPGTTTDDADDPSAPRADGEISNDGTTAPRASATGRDGAAPGSSPVDHADRAGDAPSFDAAAEAAPA